MHRLILFMCWIALIAFVGVASVAILILIHRLGMGGRTAFSHLSPEETVDTGGYVIGIGVSARGNLAVSQHSDSISVIDLATRNLVYLDVGVGAWSAEISRDGGTLLVGTETRAGSYVQVWDLKTRKVRNEVSVDADYLRRLVAAPDGVHVYTMGTRKSGLVYCINVKTGVVGRVFGPESHVHPAIARSDPNFICIEPRAISPDGNDLIISVCQQSVVVWNLRTATERFSCRLKDDTDCRAAAVSPDQTVMATDGDGVGVWDFRTGKRITKLTVGDIEAVEVSAIAFSPDGKLLVAALSRPAEFTSFLAVWRVGDYSQRVIVPCQEGHLGPIAFLPGTHRLLTAGANHTVCLWDLDKLSWVTETK
jgi:WD40 repeat protein